MTADGFPDSWDEFCLIEMQRKGKTESIELQALTEDITALDWGEKDIESTALINGGHVVKKIPMTTEGITMKVFPVSADLDGTGAAQMFHPIIGGTDDTTDPIVVPNSLKRFTYRILMLWTSELPDDGTLKASTVPSADKSAYRVQIVNAYMTSYKPSFDGKQLSAEITFKWAPMQKNGTSQNKTEESTAGGTQLDAVTAFT